MMRNFLVYGSCILSLLGGCSMNSIDINEAKKIAQSAIDMDAPDGSRTFDPGSIVEKDYGWEFTEVDKRFIENKSVNYLVIGLGPIVVDRSGYVYSVPLYIDFHGKTEEYVRQQMLERSKQK